MGRRSCVLWAILALSLLALGTVAFLFNSVSQPPTPRAAQAFFAARDTWTRRPFTHYTLVIEQQGALQPPCRQKIEMRDEQIVEVAENTCAGGVLTVDELFDRIETYTTKEVCGPNGCDCDGRIVARATYDVTFGYPQSLVIALEPRPQVIPWRLFSLQPCTQIGFVGYPSMNIVTLTPLP